LQYEINKEYVDNNGYYKIPKSLTDGYYLLKYKEDKELRSRTTVEKYRK